MLHTIVPKTTPNHLLHWQKPKLPPQPIQTSRFGHIPTPRKFKPHITIFGLIIISPQWPTKVVLYEACICLSHFISGRACHSISIVSLISKYVIHNVLEVTVPPFTPQFIVFFLFEMKLSFNCAQITIVKCKSEKIKFEKSMDVAKVVIIMNQFSQFWLLIKYESKIVKHSSSFLLPI